MLKILSLLLLHIALTFGSNKKNIIKNSNSAFLDTKLSDLQNKEISNDLQNQVNGQNTAYRLPNLADPIRYDLKLDVYFDENLNERSQFDGIVKIQFMVLSVTYNIVLHSKDLKIHSVELKYDHNKIIPVTWKNEFGPEFLVITSKSEKLKPSTLYSVEIKFKRNFTSGENFKRGDGFVLLSYVNKKGEKMYV